MAEAADSLETGFAKNMAWTLNFLSRISTNEILEFLEQNIGADFSHSALRLFYSGCAIAGAVHGDVEHPFLQNGAEGGGRDDE
jgi:hypothetical protein